MTKTPFSVEYAKYVDAGMKKTALAVMMLFSLISLAHPSFVSAQVVHATPSFVYSPLTPRVGDVVSFDALWWEQYWNENYDSRTFSYSWNFGDGAIARGVTVNHTYTEPGTYAVGVAVDDNLGTSGSSQMEIEVRERTPVTVYISLSSDSVYTGQEVTITGNLTCNSIGVPNAQIVLSSKTYIENAVWKEIASLETDDNGKYSTVWKPQRGSYQVRAAWEGNSTFPESSVSVNLGVKSFGDFVTEFSSNSTITRLNFNASTRILSFSAEGPSGTRGFVNITLERDSSFEPEGINVLLDGHPIEYDVGSAADSWILFFTYSHSLHRIIVDLSGHGALESVFPWLPIAAVSLVVAAAVAVSAVVYRNRRKR